MRSRWVVTVCQNFLAAPTSFIFSKSNPLNSRYFIPIKVILHGNYPIKKSGAIYLIIISTSTRTFWLMSEQLICIPTYALEPIMNGIIFVPDRLIV